MYSKEIAIDSLILGFAVNVYPFQYSLIISLIIALNKNCPPQF